MQFLLVEKKDRLSVHGIFHSLERANHFLETVVPDYCQRGFYMDKTLKPEDFEIIKKDS